MHSVCLSSVSVPLSFGSSLIIIFYGILLAYIMHNILFYVSLIVTIMILQIFHLCRPGRLLLHPGGAAVPLRILRRGGEGDDRLR